MNTAPSPLQGGNPSWDLICVGDQLDDIRRDHAFITTLYAIAMDKPSSMDADLLHLLGTYLDTDPRQKLKAASDTLGQIARAIRDRQK